MPTKKKTTVRKKTTARKTATRKTATRKTATRKTSARKSTARKTGARKTAARKKSATARRRSRLDPNNFGELTLVLSEKLQTRAPVTYERGRDRMRQQVADALECTPTRARHIVTNLVDKGFVRFGPHPNYRHDLTVGRWTYHPDHG